MKARSYTVGEAAALLSVSPDTVRRLADSGRLRAVRRGGGHRHITGDSIARYVAANREPPERVDGPQQSARNRLGGIVTRVVKDAVMAQVEMQAGSYRLVSLMSREAADELGLEPGVAAVAVVKATNVVIERPRR